MASKIELFHLGAPPPYMVTQEEILRFLIKTDGHIAAPAIAGKLAKVYGNAPRVELAAYTIPDDMLRQLLTDELVAPLTGTSGGSVHYRVTDKAIRAIWRQQN